MLSDQGLGGRSSRYLEAIREYKATDLDVKQSQLHRAALRSIVPYNICPGGSVKSLRDVGIEHHCEGAPTLRQLNPGHGRFAPPSSTTRCVALG